MTDQPAASGVTCALAPHEMIERLAAWKAVTALALDRHAEPGRVVSTYPASEEVARRLRDLIEAEAECCPFLEFDLREVSDTIKVELRYPPEFEPMLALIAPGAPADRR